MLTEAEKAWLACAIDGEGCIYVHKVNPKHGGYDYPAFGIYNTDIRFVTRAREILVKEFGTAPKILHQHNYDPRFRKRQQCYNIIISGIKACRMLEMILPYLIIKADRAREIIKFRTDIEARKHIRNKIHQETAAIIPRC